MDISEYKKLATRTSADLSDKETLTNSVFGLSGESGEVIELIGDQLYGGKYIHNDKLIEEIGDTMWYIAQFSSVCSIDMAQLLEGMESPKDYQLKRVIHSEPSVVICVFNLVSKTSKIADMVKKHLHQGHPLDEYGIEIALKHAVKTLVDICTRYGINFEDTLEINIEKLKRRYPQGFSVKNSVEREENNEN